MKEIILFDKIAEGNNNTLSSEEQRSIINQAYAKGIIVSSKANLRRLKTYIDTLPNEYVTLHSSFEKVRQTPDIVLFAQQLAHYASTYGTNHEGTVYLPSFGEFEMDLNEFRYIDVMSEWALCHEVKQLAIGNLALSTSVINDIMELVAEYNMKISGLETENKELRVRLDIHNGVTPIDVEQLLRTVNYMLTGSTTIVKNSENVSLYRTFVHEYSDAILKMFTEIGLIKLSSVFNRYKPLFLALKSDSKLTSTINKISKLSKKHHKPMVKPFASTFANIDSLRKLRDEVNEADAVEARRIQRKYIHAVKDIVYGSTVFQLEKYARLIRNKIAFARPSTYAGDMYNVYNIRNGKVYVKKGKELTTYGEKEANLTGIPGFVGNDFINEMLDIFQTLIEDRLQRVLAMKLNHVHFKVPASHNIDYAVPTSQKDFLGHIPYGSKINFEEGWDNLVIGIHWTYKDCGNDLDLSLRKIDGELISWNTNQKSEGITHSGDMTSANPEATEMISIYNPDKVPQCEIIVNPYSAKDNGEFTFFIAKNADYHEEGEAMDNCNSIMDNESNIIFSCKLKINGQLNLGYLDNGSFYFCGRESGKSRVMTVSTWNTHMTQAELRHMRNITRLSEVCEGTHEEDSAKVVDLTTKNKTALIDVLS